MMNTDHEPELATPPAGLIEGKRKKHGKRNGTSRAFSFALDNSGEWVRAFVYNYEPNLESQKAAYAASRSRIKLLRECAENFGKEVEAVDEHNQDIAAYVVWLRVVGDVKEDAQ